MVGSIIVGIILIVLGLIEAGATFQYGRYDSKHKEVVTGPLAVYFGAAFSILFIIFGLSLLLGATSSVNLNHGTYVIIGISLIIISILIFIRGHKVSQSQKKKSKTNYRSIQAYWIGTLALISGIVSLFK